jgi:F-type H+-transporting ATPase subunit epsilon
MSPIKLDIVTAERQVYSDDVDILIAPGTEGQLGILPNHTPLMTALKAGEMIARKGEEANSWAISGGFLEVKPDRIVVLADTAERDDEIDLERAEEAKRRAEERLKERTSTIDISRAEAALQRSLVRLQVGQRRRKRRDGPATM